MAETRIGAVVQYLRRLNESPADATDGQLLERFARQRDEAAFSALLRRHGSMVLGLCRRLLHNPHDAEDVFQAAFLLLARKAGSIRRREAVGSWLHGVAYRLASKLRTRQARRQAHERQAAIMRKTHEPVEEAWNDLQGLLAEALEGLPEHYRAALVLCYLEGKTHEEAARHLGCPLATLRSRVARGRELLRRRLSRGGLPLAAVPFAALLAAQRTDAAVPAGVLDATRAAAATGLVSDSVAALVREGLRTVGPRTLPVLGVLFTLLGIAVAGAGLVAYWGDDAQPDPRVPPAADVPASSRVDRYGDALPAEALVRFGTVRFRQGGDLRSVVFTPDGATLVSCTSDTTGSAVRLSEAATGKVLREMRPGDQDSLTCLALSADGKRAVTGGSAWDEMGKRVGVVYLWDLATGKKLRRIQDRHPEEWIECLALSPDGRTLATGSEVFFDREKPQVIRLWNLSNGKEVRELKGHEGPISAVLFMPDGKTVVSASSSRWKTVKDHTIRLWDVATGRETRRLEGHQASVRVLALSSDGRTLASGSWDSTVRLWDLDAGKETGRLPVHSGGVYSLAFARDGKRLASASGYDDLDVRLWDVTARRELCRLPKPPRPVEGLAFSPDGKVLALAGGEAHTIRLWDLVSGQELTSPAGHQAEVARVFFGPGDSVLTWSGDEDTLREWDPATGRERRHFRVPRWVFCATVSPDGRVLAYAREDKIIRLCDWAAGKELGRCEGHTDHLRGLAFSPDGKLLASGGDDRTVRLWDVSTGKEVRRFTHQDYFHALVFSPDGKSLLWAGINSCLRVWDVTTGQERLRSDRVGESIDGLAISPDGRLLAKGRPGFVELWDLTSGTEVRRLVGRRPREAITISNRCSLAFSPDGKTLAVAGWDDRVRLYELATGQERHRLAGHPGRVTCVAFSPDGRTVLTGSADTTALLWDLAGQSDAHDRAALTAADLESAWSDLETSESDRAYRAMRVLLTAPRQSVPYLRTRLHPVPVPAPERLERLLAELDNDQFAVRQKATDELRDLGAGAEAALRQRLGGKPSVETRRRLEQLLDRLGGAARLRESRAIEVLERLGGADARFLLEELARGQPGTWLTGEAKAALRRARTVQRLR